jgi:pimeloyl-ACP methyl ester carboxylesterase
MVHTLPVGELYLQQQGSGFPVLCLHGHPGSASAMSVFTHHLSQRFWTLAPDLRGYGRSRQDASFSMSDHLRDLTALLDRLAIERCVVLGWSLGGILALELAWQCPERIGGLILVATAAKPRSNHPPVTWQDLLYTGLAAASNWLQPGKRWHRELLGKRSLYRYLLQQHTELSYRYLARWGISAYLQTSAAARQALSAALHSGYDRLADLSQIQCPALILAGECDRHITAASSYETAQKLPGSSWQCYPETAHLFPWEIPQQVLTDIDVWFDVYQGELVS